MIRLSLILIAAIAAAILLAEEPRATAAPQPVSVAPLTEVLNQREPTDV